MFKRTFHWMFIAAAPFAAAQAQAEAVTSVGGEPAWSAKSQGVPLAWRSLAQQQGPAARQVYGPMPPERLNALRAKNAASTAGSPEIGIGRSLGEASTRLSALKWTAVDGGQVARVEIRSPDADGLRAGLRFRSAPPMLELRFAGSDDPSRVVLSATGTDTRLWASDKGIYWGPMTDGDTQLIELFVPKGADPASVELSVPLVSHLLVNSTRPGLAPKIGESESCHVDTACRVGELGQDFVDAKNAVAWLQVPKPDGSMRLCSGTLLNDADPATQVPYFLTAEHCFDSASEASGILTVWNYEATSCGSGVSGSTQQRLGGTMLYSDWAGPQDVLPDYGTGIALLRLASAPPAGAYFAGWDASPFDHRASEMVGIHHPAGDAKKVSLGRGNDFLRTYMFDVAWLSGSTQQGSDGSGIFTPSDSGYQFRGSLTWGFDVSCATSGNPNGPGNQAYYSRLDTAFPHIQGYLATTDQGASRDYTGAWNVPTEPGWGVTIFKYGPPTNYLFALIFIYDDAGVAKWYEYSGTWAANEVNSGTVLESTAAPWDPSFDPNERAFTPVGTATLEFSSATTADLTMTIEGVTRSAAIQMIR